MSSSFSTDAARRPVSVPAIAASKVRHGSEPLVMVTAYDAPGARIADEAGVDIILVGDSVAMVVVGYEDTLQVTVDEMAHHVAAVARPKPRPLIVGALPWMSYHVSVEDTVRNAATLVRAGAQAVKLEGGRKRIDMVKAIIDAEMPVMGHIGLTPQSIHALGGFKVQGKQAAAAAALVDDAVALSEAGCFAVVLEAVPDGVARAVRLGFDERREQRLLAWAIVVVFILGLLSFVAKGADQPADPYLKPVAAGASVPAVTVPVRKPVPGFGEIAFRVATGPKLC